MDLTAICEVLAATQQSDGQAREAAERHLTEASEGSPNELVRALAAVLAQGESVAVPIRQEAAVILRQLVTGNRTRDSVWERVDDDTKKVLMSQVLATAESDPSNVVKRNGGQVVSELATKVAGGEFSDLSTGWPEFLPAISRFIGSSSDPSTRVVALKVLKDADLGDGFMEQGESVITMLQGVLGDGSPEVRSAAVELVFQLVEDLQPEDVEPLTRVMPAVISTIQAFAKEGKEEQLKEVLEALSSSAEEEPDFFKENGFDMLWTTLVEIASAGAVAFADEEVRHSAMEAAMTLVLGLIDFFAKEGTQLERLLALNIEWLLEVEEDADAWTQEGKDDNDDDVDDDVVTIAEDNLDRIGEKICESDEEEVLMGSLFKLIRAAWQAPDSNWKHAHASLTAIQQVVEYLEEDAWVDQCVDFVSQNVGHAHPRVRYVAFGALSEIAYHHAPHVQETHHALLLPAIVAGIKDVNIRVATNAVDAFSALGDEGLDIPELEPFADELLMSMFQCLHQGQTRAMQESCLTGIATFAEIFEELFEPYYGHVMPALKQIVTTALDEKDRICRGKAFECISVVGSVVSKEMFTPDAHEVMQLMVQLMQGGFAADDQMRESVREASARIAGKLGKDFKPYVPSLLPTLFEVLKNRPKEIDDDEMPDSDDEDEAEQMTRASINGNIFGLKTMVLEEMKECLDLTNTLVESLEEDFCEFLPTTCQNLLPLLEMQLCADLGERSFKSWELLAECARAGAEKGLIDRSVLQELVAKFLETVVGAMASTALQGDGETTSFPTLALQLLQVQAVGVSGVIRKASSGILTADVVQKISGVLIQLLGKVQVSSNEMADPKAQRRKGATTAEEGEDSDSEEDMGPTVTKQNVRFALADVAGALMQTSPNEFTQVALPMYMQLVQQLLQPSASESDRSLAFYITDDAVDCLGERSVPFWSSFMNQALQGMVDKSAMVRQYATSTIGNATRQPIFEQMAPAAASQIHRILQKQGERHRRRRAVKAAALQAALAVDVGIRALGEIAEHHEPRLGEHAATVWSMWLSNLPLKYDQEGGQRAHRQLLGLVVRSHPIVTAPQNLPQVVSTLAEVYKTKFSNTSLDEDIAKAIGCMDEAPLKEVCSSIQEKHQKKVERILANAKAEIPATLADVVV